MLVLQREITINIACTGFFKSGASVLKPAPKHLMYCLVNVYAANFLQPLDNSIMPFCTSYLLEGSESVLSFQNKNTEFTLEHILTQIRKGNAYL